MSDGPYDTYDSRSTSASARAPHRRTDSPTPSPSTTCKRRVKAEIHSFYGLFLSESEVRLEVTGHSVRGYAGHDLNYQTEEII